MNKENNKSSQTIGIVALVLSILAFFTSFIVVPGILFGLIAIILSIVVFAKKGKKGLAIASLIVSIIAIIGSIIWIVFYVFLGSLDSEKIENSGIFDYVENIAETDNKFYKSEWMFDDGSVITFEEGNKFTWYQDADVTNDNYYKGTYKVETGSTAVAEIKKTEEFTNDFFTSFYETYPDTLLSDIYHLELTNTTTKLSGVEKTITDGSSGSSYFLFFDNSSTTDAAGYNLGTLSILGLSKIK